MSRDLESPRVAIVTGASQGIGAGLTSGFRAAGYAVVGTALSMPHSDEPDLLAVEGDITEAETAQRVVDRALERFGRIDTSDQQRRSLHRQAVHRLHPGGLCRDHGREPGGVLSHHPTRHQADGHPGKRSRRQRLNAASSISPTARRPSALAALTKGGLAAVARSLAIEYASRGVRCNAVALGVIETPMHDPASYAGMEGPSAE